MERISGKRIVVPRVKAAVKSKPNLLIDIQAKMQQANSPGGSFFKPRESKYRFAA